MLTQVTRAGDWITAAELADALGVTPRSVRTYVTAVNARVPGETAIESGPQGYRAGPGAARAQRTGTDAGTPRDRLHTLVRTLLDAPDGIDVYDTAERLHVSDATLDADLGRVRGLLGGTALTLERSASRARLRGTELAQRRLLSRLAHDEVDAGAFDLEAMRRTLGEDSIGAGAFGPFKAELAAELGRLGYFVNEYAIADVLMHIAIAADRVDQGRPLDGVDGRATDATAEVAALIDRLMQERLGVRLGAGDLRHLATLVLTRVVAPSATEPVRPAADIEQAVTEVVQEAASEFLVDIADDAFILRLALHVENLQRRARERAWSRNPLTKSLKSTYPMLFEVAVFITSRLQERLGTPIVDEIIDDEIAYVAMHVGERLERRRRAAQLLTATIVCPGYYELSELLRSSVDRSLGTAIEVVGVETRVDPDWSAIDTDLVLTTIDPAHPGDRIVRVQPFLTDSDIERVQAVAGRVRRARRLARLRGELERYLDASAFVHGLAPVGEAAVIRQLGELLIRQGVIDEDYVTGTIAREEMSSTAFTDALAVPHALTMTATRTAIAIGIADPSIPWGDGRVQVVAMVAFSEADREAFQTVFEQLVEVFSERESVQRILRAATTFTAFLDELVAVIDG
ncbi:transcriptional antiterminator [Microbacterium mangrovi]|uniref:Transcriptional antiterminator n=1 Tax=Microbacterium mangrovi TaxID=1348253 RepID=A0A0B2ACX6_9MICO|nr:transcriptional antiterminator [Microbacterium mangrovi]